MEKWIYKVSCLRREGFLVGIFGGDISMGRNMDSVLESWNAEGVRGLYIFFLF